MEKTCCTERSRTQRLCRSVTQGMHAAWICCLNPSRGVWMDERCTSAIARHEFAWLRSIGVPAFTDTAVPDFAFDKFVCWPQACADPERVFERAFSDRLDFIRREHSMREVILKGLSKAGGMKTVMQYLGFAPKDSFAFGDGPNDLPCCARRGRAFSWATPAISLERGGLCDRTCHERRTRSGAGAFRTHLIRQAAILLCKPLGHRPGGFRIYLVARAHTLTVDNPAKESALWMWI